jgi:glycine/serine hydroxymethyltransferase
VPLCEGGNENIDKIEVMCQDRALAAFRLDKAGLGRSS